MKKTDPDLMKAAESTTANRQLVGNAEGVHKAVIAETNRFLKASLATNELLGEFSRAIIVDSENGLLAVDPRDQYVGLTLRETGVYGREELDRILPLLDAASRVLVIGAHVGALLVPISKKVKEVIAFEANPATFRLLEINLKLNNIINCNCYNIAASDRDSELTFLLNTVNSGGSKRKPLIDNYMYSYDSPKEEIVEGKELDSFLGQQCFDLILMDIEGSEYFALKGMQNLLTLAKNLIFEFVPHHIHNISGVSIEEFAGMLNAFDTLFWPSKAIKVGKADFVYLLTHLFNEDICEDGLLMQKNRSGSLSDEV